MSNTASINKMIDHFVNDKKQFTSVDISNRVKESGVWVRNREVSERLSDYFSTSNVDYKKTRIDVLRAEDSTKVSAILYLPINSDPDEYLNTKAVAMTPDDFSLNHQVLDLDLDDEDDQVPTLKDLNDIADKANKDAKEADKNVVGTKGTQSKTRNFSRFKFL